MKENALKRVGLSTLRDPTEITLLETMLKSIGADFGFEVAGQSSNGL